MSDSPMEELFWQEWHQWTRHTDPVGMLGLQNLDREHQVGRYRVDFALPELHVAIEIDGFDFHSSREQLISDRRRQREIEAEGWRVIRFAGSEIRRDVETCVLQVMDIVRRMPLSPEAIERQQRYEELLMAEQGLTEADIDRS
jgi:very-short-patch-repair endonuclease